MITKIEGTYLGATNKIAAFDFTFDSSKKQMPIVIFCHGFKGFKDWGGFNLIANYFANNNFACLKFNFTHNGTTATEPSKFIALENFATNTFAKEMQDLQAIEHLIISELVNKASLDLNKIYLIGHSKGGVSALLHIAHNNSAIKKIITWCTPIDFFRFFNKDYKTKWKENGVQYVINSRTGEKMPLALSVLEDYENNLEFYDVAKALSKIKIPYLIIHGKDDESVNINHAHDLKKASKNSDLVIIPNAGHTFNMTHPDSKEELPDATIKALALSWNFMQIN